MAFTLLIRSLLGSTVINAYGKQSRRVRKEEEFY